MFFQAEEMTSTLSWEEGPAVGKESKSCCESARARRKSASSSSSIPACCIGGEEFFREDADCDEDGVEGLDPEKKVDNLLCPGFSCGLVFLGADGPGMSDGDDSFRFREVDAFWIGSGKDIGLESLSTGVDTDEGVGAGVSLFSPFLAKKVSRDFCLPENSSQQQAAIRGGVAA
jgi:hypothetical protein